MSAPQSSNKIGLWAATSLVVGNMIGAGIFMMPATLAAYGCISLIGWLFASLGSLCMAFVFSRLSKMLPGISGGPYTYARSAFGDCIGFLIAWGYWISVWCTNAAIAVSLVSALSTFVPALNGNAFISVITGLSAIWFLTWINSKGIVTTGAVQLITTLLKIVPLLAIAFVGLFFIRKENFLPFNLSGQSTFSAVSSTAAMTIFAFLGIECATIPAAQVKHPEKNIPRATILGTVVTTLIYILSTISVLGVVAAKDLQHSVTPFADAAKNIFGNNSNYWVSAGVAIAAFGALNGWILIQGQIPLAIAKDRLFPSIFAKENKQHSPVTGIVIGSILASLLMMMNYTKGLVEQFKFLILLSTLTSVVPYLFCMSGFIILNKKTFNNQSTVIPNIIALLAFVFALWIIAGSGQEIVYWGFLLMMAGIPLYTWVIHKQQKDQSSL
jgi:APA family basic amino acid/polyamine antiporter